MPDTDDMTDVAELRELRDCAAGLAVAAPPSLGAIQDRARAHRRHRRASVAGLCVAGAAVATALVFAPTDRGAAPSPTAEARAKVPPMIRNAAFTLVSNSDGTVSLTIDPAELFDPTVLRDDLAQYGIAAMVTTGRFCSSDPAPEGLAQAVSFQPGTHTGDNGTITVDPDAIPTGTQLSFGTIPGRGFVASYTALVDPSAYSCTDQLLTDDQQQAERDGFLSVGPN